MALIKCPKCGKQISDKAANCIGCGVELAAISKCEECGEVILPGVAACPNCGCPVENAAAETVKPAPAVLPTPEPVKQPEPVTSVSKPVPEPAATAVQPIPEPVAAMPMPAATTVPQPAAPAVQQTATAPFDEAVLIEGDSGKLKSSLVWGIVDIVFGTSLAVLLMLLNPFLGVLDFILFIHFGIQSLREYLGYQIKVTQTAITGYAYYVCFGGVARFKVDLPINSVASVTKVAKNSIMIITNEKKKYRFNKLTNRDQIFDVINSLISSR